jgi:prepilin-type N-terminal cleavage/methylation domain-containing protein
MRCDARHQPGQQIRNGFTLIEAAVVIIIVGVGIVGLMQLLAAGSMVNASASELTTAVYLANNIDEMLQGQSYATLKSTYDNQTYSGITGPIDATGTVLSEFSGWAQVLSVKYVDDGLLTSVVSDSQYEPTCRVSVTITHHGNAVYTAKWLMAAPS